MFPLLHCLLVDILAGRAGLLPSTILLTDTIVHFYYLDPFLSLHSLM